MKKKPKRPVQIIKKWSKDQKFEEKCLKDEYRLLKNDQKIKGLKKMSKRLVQISKKWSKDQEPEEIA